MRPNGSKGRGGNGSRVWEKRKAPAFAGPITKSADGVTFLMLRKRDLPQALAAQGLTGGMSESALAGMYNSYGNNRNTIDRGRNESLAALLDTLNSNRSSALQSYNSQLSAAEQQKMAYQMQLEQALANGSAEILQNKYDTLQNLDNAYAQQILALQQAAAQAAQKRW